MKKILAIALAVVMILSCAVIAFAEDVDESKTYPGGLVVDGSEAWNSAGGDQYLLAGNFDVTITFENEPFIRNEDNWSNFVFEIFGGEGTKGITLRADAFGWTYGEEAQEPTFTVEKSWGDDWSGFVEMCKNNKNVTLNLKKTSDTVVTVTISFGDAATETYTITYANGVPASMRVQVGSDGGKVTILECEIKTEEVEDPEDPGETEPEETEPEVTEPEETEPEETEPEETEPEETEPTEPVAVTTQLGNLSVDGFFSARTDMVPLKSGESYVITFKNTSTGSLNWDNFILAIVGETGAAYTGAEQEIAIIRADAWGWGGGYSDFVAPDQTGNALSFTSNVEDWDAFVAAAKAGTNVTLTVVRNGNTISYTAKIGSYTVSMRATSGKALPETIYLFLTGEKVNLTNIVATKYTGSPATGDSAMPYAFAALAVIAAGAVIVLEKKRRFAA